jgi:uncharacterized protein (DUF1501 family)
MPFSSSAAAPCGDTLVVIFLRGAADGLNMVVPHGEEEYHRLRSISLGEQIPRSLYGPVPSSAFRSISDFHFGESKSAQTLTEMIGILYAGENKLSLQVKGRKPCKS